jgi:Predicted methylated DNA-protein cysteine methyltransferase
MASSSTQLIIETIKRIPRGRVASYGQIAALAGLANGARQVVRVLHSSSEKEKLPWFRLVRKDGSIALPPGEGYELQRSLLENEDIEVVAGRVDLSRFGWVQSSSDRARRP